MAVDPSVVAEATTAGVASIFGVVTFVKFLVSLFKRNK